MPASINGLDFVISRVPESTRRHVMGYSRAAVFILAPASVDCPLLLVCGEIDRGPSPAPYFRSNVCLAYGHTGLPIVAGPHYILC